MKDWFIRHRILVIAFALIILSSFVYWRSLPEPLFAEPLSSILTGKDGELLGAKIAADEQWRFPYLQKVPDKYKTAVIHYEDKRFYSHPGVDPLALVRSLYLNISQGKIVSGASTLSMQVIRLARKNPKRGYVEKIIEMLLAVRLELTYSKKKVLAFYASYAPFGGNVVGLEAASWRYFGRGPDKLSWAESCTLAVLPNSPSLIHPGKNRSKLKNKRDQLLKILNKKAILTDMELNLALHEPLPEKPVPLPRVAPHLLDTLLVKGKKGRHRFASTLKRALQTTVQDVVTGHHQALSLKGIHNVAVLVVDNRSFEVIAYIGNSDVSLANEQGYAIDIIRRPRSTGSILKPLLFAAMIQAGEILPKTLVPDIPTQYGGYMPENYDRSYRGAVPAQIALAKSLNVPAVRMLKQYGIHRFYDFLQNMGMTTLHRPADDYGLTLILGGAESSLWDLTAMYANLAHIAQKTDYHDDDVYQKSKLLQRESSSTTAITEISPATAWLTLNALLEVNRPGNEVYWKNFSSTQKIAWKTGTSFGLRDAWAIGTTPKYTVGVWVGNASGEGRPELIGVTSAAPVLFDVFNVLDSSDWFAKPKYDMKEVEVCQDDGYLVNGGCKKEKQWIPEQSHFDRVSPYHRTIHLDNTGSQQVHGQCESPNNMLHKSWFILPPAQEFYYRKHHSDYRILPKFRQGCQKWLTCQRKQSPIDFLYPNEDTKLYIPIDLAEKKGRTVFEAVHRDQNATLYWHLDNQYLGSTKTFHQQALDISPGVHYITVVDQQGNQLSRRFEILSKED